MKPLQTIRAIIRAIVIAIMVVNVLAIFTGILTRYVFKFALGFTDELGGYSMVWITFLGSVWALIDDAHISFETLVEKLPQRTQRYIGIFNNLAGAVFAFIVVYFGTNLTIINMDVRAISMPVSRAFIFSVIPVSGLMMFFIFVARAIAPWKTGREEAKARLGGVDLEKEVV